jgi:hypothetical protein
MTRERTDSANNGRSEWCRRYPEFRLLPRRLLPRRLLPRRLLVILPFHRLLSHRPLCHSLRR